jgi:hypothetical protein
MKVSLRSSFAVAIASLALLSSANARDLCSDPPHPIDQRACDAAEQGPEALRRFIDRMRPIRELHFYDYVNQARLVAWDARDEYMRALAQAGKTASAAGKELR